jgi:hypothetical protein
MTQCGLDFVTAVAAVAIRPGRSVDERVEKGMSQLG